MPDPIEDAAKENQVNTNGWSGWTGYLRADELGNPVFGADEDHAVAFHKAEVPKIIAWLQTSFPDALTERDAQVLAVLRAARELVNNVQPLDLGVTFSVYDEFIEGLEHALVAPHVAAMLKGTP